MQHYANDDFKDNGFSRIDFQFETLFEGKYALYRELMEQVADQFDTLYANLDLEGTLREFSSIDIASKFLRTLVRQKPNKYFCKAGRTCYAVTPEGGLYPCAQFAAFNNFCLGSLDTEMIL